MEEEIKKDDIREYCYYEKRYGILLAVTLVSIAPSVYLLGIKGLLITGILFTVNVYFACRLESQKKKNNVQTYREILAFKNGERLDEIQRLREEGKRNYQTFLYALGSGIAGFVLAYGIYKALTMIFG